MTLAIIIAFSLLLALVAAGLVWYGWALAQNLNVVATNVRARAAAKAAEAADE